eukprot:gene35827-61758_t
MRALRPLLRPARAGIPHLRMPGGQAQGIEADLKGRLFFGGDVPSKEAARGR